jgi:predicted ATPase/DNA-binding CsgD family transcriptional regulator
VGKTRLALQVLEDERRGFPDGAWVAYLADLADPNLLEPTIASAVGLRSHTATPATFLTDFLADRRALLVLDGCERVVPVVADAVVRLREACPELRIVATSRQRLGVSGEAVVLVPPLTTPDPATPHTADALTHIEAVALFVDRARLASSDFELTEENAQAVAELCAALEGIPLALELAAARIGILSPQEMVRQLADRFRLLDQGYRDAPDRHQSLRSCVEWSYELCTASEQTMWCRLSALPGGCDLAGATAVCVGDGIDAGDVLDLIGSLVDKSVVRASHAPDGSVRYGLLDHIAAYGRDRLRASSQLEHWRRRQAEWCADLAERFRTDWVGAHQAELLRQMRREHANVRAALEFCFADDAMPEAGLRIATDLDYFWLTTGLADEARHWLEVGIASHGGEPAERSLAMVLAARFAGLQHDLVQARLWLDQAPVEAETADDARTGGLLLVLTSALAVWDGDAGSAVEASGQAIPLLHEAGDVAGELLALHMSGTCHAFAGDRVGAVAAYERAVALAEQHGETFRMAYALTGLGDEALATGEAARADELFGQALRMKAALGDRMGVAVALDSLGRSATALGDGERAAILLGAAESIWDVIGMHETRNPFATASSPSEGISQARSLLGKKAFRVAFRRGSTLTDERAISYALGEALGVDQTPEEPSPLTRRETEIAELVAEGLSNPQIAKRLVISVRTAQGHVENILRKLGFTSRAMIAAWVTERRAQAEASRTVPALP